MNKMKQLKLWSLLLIAGGFLTFLGCSEDNNDPAGLEIVSITATGTNITTGSSITVDLNGATSATDIPVDGTITVTFSRPVDAATATSTNITLSDETANVTLAITASGSEVMIAHDEELVGGTIYTISISSALAAEDGGKFVAASRTFTTAGRKPAVVPQAANLVVYLPFDGEVTETFNHPILNSNVTFGEDRLGNFEGAAVFNGTTNYVGVQYAADMSNANTTVSYWMKLPNSQGLKDHMGITDPYSIKQYVTFCIGGNNGTYHEFNRFTCCDFGYDIDVLKYFTNHLNSGSASTLAGSHIEMKNEGNPGGDKVVEIDNPTWVEDQTDKWVHIVTSWNASAHRKAFYINGVPSTVYELTPSADYSLDDAIIDVEGIDADPANNKNLYLGSGVPYWATITSDGITPFRSGIPFAFKGQMDDFRMFSVALTDAEVLALYDAEKP